MSLSQRANGNHFKGEQDEKVRTVTKNKKSTFFGSMLNFFLPMAICLFLWDVLLQDFVDRDSQEISGSFPSTLT